jgi:hypothetical protein
MSKSRQSQKPRKKMIKIVGGGIRSNRDSRNTGGSMKSKRRVERKRKKAAKKNKGKVTG